ncbi:FAD-binding oxidoreductase [Afifella sp. JA880]|uniref:NAD(P)/FAD-dependent oxidoreductase n=1 Tax=Afifella sp. JA880 TaxID=2975280 RepID=UPI0021BA6FEA|nr:FAD-binding oxidoreductase [Afifella sp. JA880]MCT8266619.1 FAD-binding oxidoreductase [Afifella sp. JA880]
MSKTAQIQNSPYWWVAAPVRPLPAQSLPQKTDVLIVGAGFAGLTAAVILARAGRSVVVVDKMMPGEGASSRNGGITSGNIRPSFDELSRRFGEDRALAIEAEGKTAREFLYDFIRTEKLDCDFQPVGKFGGAIGREQYEAGARTAETLHKRLGIEAFAVPQAEQSRYIGSDFYRGGHVRMDIGGVHPAKLAAEILRLALEAGAAVHSGTEVKGVRRDGAEFSVETSAGTVSARQVLVCTNGYTDGSDPWLRRRLIPVRSRIIVTDPLPIEVMDRLMPSRMMYSEGLILGHYFRPTPDGTRILLGGRDASTGTDETEPTENIRQGLLRIFPELKNVGLSHSWYGHVAMNWDMVPRLFEREGVTYATGFCGSGVVWAPWLGTRAAHKLLGDDQARTAFEFRPPAAIPFYNGKPYFLPAVIQGYRLRDRLALARATR